MPDAPKTEVAAPGGKKKLIIVVVAAVLAIGAAVGVTLALTHHRGKEAVAKHHKADAKAKDADETKDADEEAATDDEAAADTEDGAADEEAAADEEKGGEEGKEGKAGNYLQLDPAFVVNFQDEKKRTKFLKAEISVAANSKAQAAITQHMPAVRNSLVMLLSRQVYEELVTSEGKEKLRTDALAAVREVIVKQTNKKTGKAVKDLYFSSLVMQ
ncbi:MAG: flagellar basal body-associated FliL family protein [Gammaproteobacteria bacterium]|nr:flagellar basal body-associated FliL family protein [Gammaproteobacteria bacterium]